MLSRLFRFLRTFFRQSRTINEEPLNKVSLIVIILVDIFILVNVFTGLDDIARWHINPSEAHPCYSEWEAYRNQTDENKDFNIIRRAARTDRFTFQEQYRQAAIDRLGKVDKLCFEYAEKKDAIGQTSNISILQTLEEKQGAIANLEASNRTIREQYDSTLLEEIAKQPRDRSINSVDAAQAKATLEQNEVQIDTLKSEISKLESDLVSKPESVAFLAFLKKDPAFQAVERGYERATFWYPSIQLTFQAFFLAPLILIALVAHKLAQRRRYGLISLISWHLLAIFFIPLIFRIFTFLQVGVLFDVLFDIVRALFGNLLFLVSYAYILLIPLIGFGSIKLLQRFIFNPKLQAAGRVQKSRCIKCGKKLNSQDSHCPHCGYYQYLECSHCHQLTYKYLPHCKQCGAAQEIENLQ